MTDHNDNILEDLEVAGDDVTGGTGIGLNVLGQDASVNADQNRSGGYTVSAGSAEVETKEKRDGTHFTVEYGDDEAASGTIRGTN